ncbi:hypothetical protein PIB30_094952 [Stylosanthes scabra]|uniref:Uncharacterized protein n=1 Tax=Stylosanthes scabra TaxID=79078 RepID=A0ABU6RWI4_9FABA|nr:hypothetical protein [Stylosanthes scabra]
MDIRECLCDPGACGSIMLFELYETLDLGLLKKSKGVFTMVGGLTIPTDFHVIMPTKGDKGGRSQVLLGRLFLKIVGFKLQYDDDTFSFSVGKTIETFPVTPPPTPRKKRVHHFQKGVGDYSPSSEEEGKKEGLKPEKKKKKREEVKSRKKKKHKEDEDEERIALKCSSLGNLLGKLKKIGKALRNNQKMDAHLVKDQSKWK